MPTRLEAYMRGWRRGSNKNSSHNEENDTMLKKLNLYHHYEQGFKDGNISRTVAENNFKRTERK